MKISHIKRVLNRLITREQPHEAWELYKQRLNSLLSTSLENKVSINNALAFLHALSEECPQDPPSYIDTDNEVMIFYVEGSVKTEITFHNTRVEFTVFFNNDVLYMESYEV